MIRDAFGDARCVVVWGARGRRPIEARRDGSW